MSVAALVLEDGGDEDEAIAALLHDALEDCADVVSASDLEEQFGPRVRDLVIACTDTPPDYAGGRKPDWTTRKTAYIASIAHGDVPMRVSLADKVHNARSILRDHRTSGEAVWERFSATRAQTLWYYNALIDAYRSAGASGFLLDELERTIRAIETRLPDRPAEKGSD
jgi:(p)ppGpp synthase/HD superfamily hydrolase